MLRKNALLLNIYRERAKKDYTMRIECFRTEQKNILFGLLRNLVEMFLAQLPFRLETEIDAEKMCILFEKQKPGLIKCERNIFLWVRRKPFEKWVRQNATRICKTKKQMRHEKQELNQKFFRDEVWEAELDKAAERVIDDMMERELDRMDRMFLSRR